MCGIASFGRRHREAQQWKVPKVKQDVVTSLLGLCYKCWIGNINNFRLVQRISAKLSCHSILPFSETFSELSLYKMSSSSGSAATQYFSLRWNNHPVNLVSVFTGLYQVTAAGIHCYHSTIVYLRANLTGWVSCRCISCRRRQTPSGS